jgi:hypothetical protein
MKKTEGRKSRDTVPLSLDLSDVWLNYGEDEVTGQGKTVYRSDKAPYTTSAY